MKSLTLEDLTVDSFVTTGASEPNAVMGDECTCDRTCLMSCNGDHTCLC